MWERSLASSDRIGPHSDNPVSRDLAQKPHESIFKRLASEVDVRGKPLLMVLGCALSLAGRQLLPAQDSKEAIPEICFCGTLQVTPTPEEPIGLLPLTSSRSLPLVQMVPPSVARRSKPTRKKIPESTIPTKNLASSPST